MKQELLFLRIDGSSNSLYKELARDYFAKLVDSGLHTCAFYDGSVVDGESFISLGMNTQVIMYLVADTADDSQICGHFHLNGFQGRMAMIHFSLSPTYRGRNGMEIAKKVIKEIFKLQRASGGPLVTSLVGITPVSNKLACRFIKRLGFNKVMIGKDCCEFADGHFEDGLITYREAE